MTISIFDVGANLGEFGLELAKRNRTALIHLIEPIPEMADNLEKKSADLSLDNVLVHRVALGELDKCGTLHISNRGDYGTTSLLNFDIERIASDPYWVRRKDLVHQVSIPVTVCRLETLMSQLDISSIDFIKIDAQGLDLSILESAGNFLKFIKAGMIEVPTTERSALYVGEQQTLQSALNFLSKHGFTVIAVKPNDPACNEVNVFFTRYPDSWDNDVVALGLKGLPAFDGKHYWHAFSNSPEYADELNLRLLEENARLLSRIDQLDARVLQLSTRIADLDAELNKKTSLDKIIASDNKGQFSSK